jgi:glutaredoxin
VTTVTLYTKPDCSLCDDALSALERVRRERPFEIEKIDISASEELRGLYGERIPVVALDGEPKLELHVDERQVAELLDLAEARG